MHRRRPTTVTNVDFAATLVFLTRFPLSQRQIALGRCQILPLVPSSQSWCGMEGPCGIEKAMQESEDKFRGGRGGEAYSPLTRLLIYVTLQREDVE
jgi:hypothetical protein